MMVTVPRIARPIDVNSFADFTSKQVLSVEWLDDGGLGVQFAVNLTNDEIVRVRIRCMSTDANHDVLLWQAYGAYQTNSAFLAIPAPTTAQSLAQVRSLSQQMQGVLRVLAPLD